MFIILIRNKKSAGPAAAPQPGNVSFKQHNEEMKQFRLGHPKLSSGGSGDILMPEGDILAVANGVKLALYSQN